MGTFYLPARDEDVKEWALQNVDFLALGQLELVVVFAPPFHFIDYQLLNLLLLDGERFVSLWRLCLLD